MFQSSLFYFATFSAPSGRPVFVRVEPIKPPINRYFYLIALNENRKVKKKADSD